MFVGLPDDVDLVLVFVAASSLAVHFGLQFLLLPCRVLERGLCAVVHNRTITTV